MSDIYKGYQSGELCGWAEVRKPGLAKAEFKLLSAAGKFSQLPKLSKAKLANKKTLLYLVAREVLGKDITDYPQEIGDPFAAGTMVAMADGTEKPIESLVIGDVVLNHKNEPARVTNVIKKQFTGRMITVKLKGWHRSLTATETHHGMTISERYDGFEYESPNRVKFGEMNVGDFMLTPHLNMSADGYYGVDYKADTGSTALMVKPSKLRCPYGTIRRIDSIEYREVKDETVYCITTENEFTAVFNGMAQYQCVSFGAKNASEILQAVQIGVLRQAIKWRPVFPPYYYGTGRVYVGNGRLGNGDGSLGSWMATAVMRYGTLYADEPNVPKYSGAIAKAWGDPNPRNDLDLWLPKAKEFLVKSAAPVKTWDELVTAISSGYPVTIASNVGFEMQPGRDGFHRQVGSWAHQMVIHSVDNRENDPYAIIGNSWGDVHGELKDFDDGHRLPIACLRVRRADVEKILRAGESFAFSDMQGFPDRSAQLERWMFDLIGKD